MPDATTDAPSGKPKAKAAKAQLDREAKRALLNHHIGILRSRQKDVAEARGPYDAALNDLTAAVHEAQADLGKKGYPRKYLLALVEDTLARRRDLGVEEKQRFEDRQDLNLPVFGEQLALDFDDSGKATDTEKDILRWEGEGYIRGRRGDLRELQDGDPPQFHQDIIRGFRSGQTETQTLLLAAKGIIDQRGQPDAEAEPKDLNGGGEALTPEPGSPEAKAAERKSVARAKEGLENLGKRAAANKVAA